MQVKQNALVFETEEPNLITSTIKKSAVISDKTVAVHWGFEEAQTLAELGIPDVLSPITRDYKWSGRSKPFDHQMVTSAFLTLNKKAFCFSEQGTGKTASVIWAVDYLMKLGLIKRVLVICPLSVVKATWQADLFKFAMHRSCSIAHGSAAVRKKVLAAGSEFVVINFDGVGVIKKEIIAAKFDLIVVDECNA